MAKMQALVIKTAGDRTICELVAGQFESNELRRLRTENAVLRRNRDELKRREIEALGREIDAYLYGRRVVWKIQKVFWRITGAAQKKRGGTWGR